MDDTTVKKFVYGVLTLTVYIVFGWAYFHYRKESADWFGINIAFYTVPAVALVILGATRLEWFRERIRSAPGSMFAIAAGGFLVCLFLGIFFTEPMASGVIPVEYNYSASRTGEEVVYFIGNIGGGESSSSSSSGSGDIDFGDDAGEALVFLLLIILVIVLIFGSAFIPHFWVLACAVLIAVMGLLAYRELVLKGADAYEYG